MASLIEYANGLRRIEFTLTKGGPRRLLRLGRMPRRDAERLNSHLEHLIAAKVAGFAIDAETGRWLAQLDQPLYQRLVAMDLVPPRQGSTSHTLREVLARFKQVLEVDVKPATAVFYGHTLRNLESCFGDIALSSITPGMADDYRAWLARHEHLTPATVNRRITAVKTIFRKALRWQMVDKNPFDGVKSGGSTNESRKQFIPQSDILKILDICPHIDWKVLIVLSRFGGLRIPSEALPLTWADLNWDKGTLLVHSPKTEHHEGQASRLVPLFPMLRNILLEAFEKAEPGATWIITRYRDSNANLRQHFERIILRAGLTPWPKPWHNMRASRQSELMAEFDLATACRWLGNSPTVAARHYAMSTDRDGSFQRAISREPGAVKSAVDLAGITAHEREHEKGDMPKRPVIHDNTLICTVEHIDILGGEGLEPPTSAV